jgi:glycosyltransferase involved in cell wall biosynthesis
VRHPRSERGAVASERQGGGDRPGLLIILANYDGHGGLQEAIDRLARSIAAVQPVTVITWSPRRLSRRRAEGDLDLSIITVPSLLSWDRERAWVPAAVNTFVSVLVASLAALAFHRRWSTLLAGGLDPEGVVAGLVAPTLGRPFVVGTWMSGPTGNAARIRRSPMASPVVALLRRARAAMAENAAVADELAGAGIDPARIRVVPHGVDLEAYRPVGDAGRRRAASRLGLARHRVVSYCGRFALDQKRLDVLLAAWAQIPDDDWVLVLCGDGPDRDRLDTLGAGCAPGTTLVLGWQQDVRPVLAASDIFVLPTVEETTALAMGEAMACGIPGVVSAIPSFVAAQPQGVVLVRNRPDDWATAMRSLMDDQARRAEMGRAARDWAARHRDHRSTVAAYREALGIELAAL